MKLMNLKKYTAVPVLALLASPAFAAIDTTAALAAFTDGETAVAAIAAAALIMVIGIKVWKRLRGAA